MNFSNMSFDEFKKYCEAVYSLEPDAKFSVDKETNKLTWELGTQPSDSAIETEMARLDTLYTNQEYARKRKAKYDALNQFELISDDAINGTTTHKDAIVAIKSEFPKP